MKNILKEIGAISLITAGTLGLISIFVVVIINLCKGTYEYKDYDDNYGVAEICYTSYADMYCIEENGTTIKVVEFRKVK